MDLGSINEGGAAACLAWLSLTGIVYLVIFLSDRRRRAYGWLALQALSAALHPLWFLGLAHPLIGQAHTQVLSAALATGCLASVHFTHARFRLSRPSPAWAGVLLTAALVCALAEGPVVTVAILASAATIAYQIIAHGRLIRHTPPVANAATMLAGWLLLGIAAAADLTAWLGIASAPDLIGIASAVPLGLTAFAFLQTVALARDHLESINQTERLKDELDVQLEATRASFREIEVLNRELRRQIRLRSSQLAEALSRLSNGGGGEATLDSGDVVAHRYRVIAPLGTGAMGSVYEVERLSDGRRLALKVLNGKPDKTTLARFAREAHILSELHHPNLLSLYDVDVSESGVLFLVMELVRGAALDDEHERWGDAAWALPVVRQIADGLRSIHATGVVHRDLKPANILVAHGARSSEPLIKVADFGVASLAARRELLDTRPLHLVAAADTERLSPLTTPGLVMGTPRYMAPELADGTRSAGMASDVFSFGILAYELLSGDEPFAEPPFAQRLRGMTPTARQPLASLRPDLVPEVAGIVDRCLCIEPRDRPTAEEIAHTLGSVTDHAARLAS